MPDKTFNEQPMITVVSDSMDPRIQRQMKSQLQSTMMTISEVTAELDNQKAMQDIKAQKDSVKDQTEFDDENTNKSADPKPIEDNAGTNNENSDVAQTASGNQTQTNGGDAVQPTQGSGEAKDDPFQDGGDQSGTNSDPSTNDQAGGGNTQSDPQASVQPDQNDGGQTPQPQGNNANQPNPQGNADSGAQQGQTPNQAGAGQNQQTQGSGQSSQSESQKSTGVDNSGGGEEDPFTDDNINFETFAGILGFNYKTEDASQQTDDTQAPPIKNVVYIKGSDAGVDSRTSAVVATIEDPQNTVIIMDLSEVAEVEAKLQFKALTKQLQGRNIMVTESVDQCVEYLNQVYDEIAGNAE